MKQTAFKFESKSDLRKAIEELERISEKVPGVRYNIVPGKTILVFSYFLQEHVSMVKFGGTELKVGSFDNLSPKEQARRRGLLMKKPA